MLIYTHTGLDNKDLFVHLTNLLATEPELTKSIANVLFYSDFNYSFFMLGRSYGERFIVQILENGYIKWLEDPNLYSEDDEPEDIRSLANAVSYFALMKRARERIMALSLPDKLRVQLSPFLKETN